MLSKSLRGGGCKGGAARDRAEYILEAGESGLSGLRAYNVGLLAARRA